MIGAMITWLEAKAASIREDYVKRLRVDGYKQAAATILVWASADIRNDALIEDLRRMADDPEIHPDFRGGINAAFADYAKLAERDK